jgi:hypothetical protein
LSQNGYGKVQILYDHNHAAEKGSPKSDMTISSETTHDCSQKDRDTERVVTVIRTDATLIVAERSRKGLYLPSEQYVCYRSHRPPHQSAKNVPKRLAPALHQTSRPHRPGTHYGTSLHTDTISEHKHWGIRCKLVCAKCVPYNPVVHRFLPCWAVVLCLFPSMFGQLPGPGHNFPVKLILFHQRVRLR